MKVVGNEPSFIARNRTIRVFLKFKYQFAIQLENIVVSIELRNLLIFLYFLPLCLQLVQPIPKLVTLKLDDGNFLTCKQQVLTAIRGYRLENFFTGMSVFPLSLLVMNQELLLSILYSCHISDKMCYSHHGYYRV